MFQKTYNLQLLWSWQPVYFAVVLSRTKVQLQGQIIKKSISGMILYDCHDYLLCPTISYITNFIGSDSYNINPVKKYLNCPSHLTMLYV